MAQKAAFAKKETIMSKPFKWNLQEVDREVPTRKLGMGAMPVNGASKSDRTRALIGFIKQVATCPTYNLPVLDNVTVHYDGPLTDAALTSTFGEVINPLGANPESPPPGSSQVDTTFAEPGKFQTFNLICGIQWRLDLEPLSFTVLGNSWAPAGGTTAGAPVVAMPVSPTDFNVNASNPDTATAGPLGLASGETMTQAALEWAWWSELACYYMARGYNLDWQWGNRARLLNDTLRYTAFTPSNAQDGSASNSNVDINYFVRRTNNYYQSILGASQIFLAADRSRIGNMTLTGVGQSVFRPDRSNEFVGATFGGVGLKQYLKGNGEFRRLTTPFLCGPGIPIGLKARQSNTDDGSLMRQYFSATYGFGGAAPVSFTPSSVISPGASVAGTSAVTGAEPSLDSPVAPRSQQLNGARVAYKGGAWKLTIAFKGFELTADQAQGITDPDVQRAIQAECGCTCNS
jgi:hypothetical protein